MRLIIVDGLDGVGKDTHALLIKQWYQKKGFSVVVRSHPQSDNFYGRTAKKALLGKGKINRLIASVFYAVDVLRSLRLFYRRPQSDVLIMVRYLMGTAYLPSRLATAGYHVFEKLVPTSEYMFFLDAPPQVLLDRLKRRKEKEMFETYDKLVKVRKRALMVAGGWFIIDTVKPVDQTFSVISDILDRLDGTS